jgi:hypothetical protein
MGSEDINTDFLQKERLVAVITCQSVPGMNGWMGFADFRAFLKQLTHTRGRADLRLEDGKS